MDPILIIGLGELVLLRPVSEFTSSAKLAEREGLIQRGVSIVPGDISTASFEEIAVLFKSFHTVVACTGFVGGAGTQIKLARAALKASVKRYFPWQFGVDYEIVGRVSGQDLFDEQLDVRDLLRAQQSTKWVIISTGVFTNFLFLPFFGVVEYHQKEGSLPTATVHALGSLQNEITLTTVQDIGKMTAEIICTTPVLNDQVVYIAGDTITYDGFADILEAVLQSPVERDVWSVEMLEEKLREDPGDAMRKYHLAFARGKGIGWPVEKTFNGKKGIRLTNAREWAEAHLKITL